MTLLRNTAFSWRQDPQVPDFEDDRVLAIMDGDCALCSASARRIARWDKQDRVRIAPIQSPLGHALARHYGLDPDDPDTWVVLDAGQAYASLDASIYLFPRLHWAFAPLRLLGFLPRFLREWLYARVARNRYSLFGRTDMCALPDPELRRRLISRP